MRQVSLDRCLQDCKLRSPRDCQLGADRRPCQDRVHQVPFDSEVGRRAPDGPLALAGIRLQILSRQPAQASKGPMSGWTLRVVLLLVAVAGGFVPLARGAGSPASTAAPTASARPARA